MKLQHEKIPFTMVANEVLANPEISLKAKGLYAYLFSKPDGWQFSAARMVKECRESRPTLLAVLKELETHCLLQRKKHQNGRVDYILTFAICTVPQSQGTLLSPESKNRTVKESHREEVLLISNKDRENKKDIAAKPQQAFIAHETRQKWYEGKDEAFQLIAFFFDKKGLWKKYDTRDKVAAVARRHLRAARQIIAAGWSQQEVEKAIGKIPEKLKDEWTLETCIKYLTK
jgi:hypothetical protein